MCGVGLSETLLLAQPAELGQENRSLHFGHSGVPADVPSAGREDFLELPLELQEFVCQPVNLPYLELALTLSDLSAKKLRSVAEGILDITF